MTNIKLSKNISYLLRHNNKPLYMNTEGWVNTQDLLNYFKINIDELDEIVKSDDKKRYSYNLDKSKIRANQGHSLPFVKIKYPEVIPPTYLFHGTNPNVIQDIKKTGIEKRTRTHVHLSVDKETAYNVGIRHSKNIQPYILIIYSEKMYNDGYKFYLSENNVWLSDFIPSKYIINI